MVFTEEGASEVEAETLGLVHRAGTVTHVSILKLNVLYQTEPLAGLVCMALPT
jgi:hypothetical protein